MSLCNANRWTHLQKLTIIGSWFTHVFISSHQLNFLQVYAVVIWFKDFLKLNSNKNLKMCRKSIQPSFLGMCKCHVCGMRSSHRKEIMIQLDPRIGYVFCLVVLFSGTYVIELLLLLGDQKRYWMFFLRAYKFFHSKQGWPDVSFMITLKFYIEIGHIISFKISIYFERWRSMT